MEPLASSAGLTPLLRPVGAVNNDPSSFLREGRLMSGEVMQNLGGDSVLIAIGNQEMTAQTQVELLPGQRFLFQVVQQGGELVLRLVEDTLARAKLDQALVETLRSLIGKSRPIGQVHGEVLGDLAQLMHEEGGERQLLQGLSDVIETRAFQPDQDGAELKELLSHSGLAYESVLMAALMQVGADDLESALKRLASAIRGRLLFTIPGTQAFTAQQVEAFVGVLPGMLKQIFDKLLRSGRAGSLAEASPEALSALSSEFQAELEQLLQRMPDSQLKQAALGNLAHASGGLLAGKEAALLRALLGMHGRNALTGERGRSMTQRLQTDKKGLLLAGMLESDSPRVHETLGRTLAALDLEQLVGSLRREFGEGEHLSFPVQDGEQFATAHLFIQGDGRQRSEFDPPDDGERCVRLIFGVDFSQLGPLRADMIWHAGRLSARLQVANPKVADQLRRAAGELEQRMAQGGAQVRIAIQDATRADTDLELLVRDIRFLRDHHLMDVEG